MALKLSRRLMLCAEFVRSKASLADIGTDHGYLPIWLLQNGRITRAIAADINPMPLERCKAAIDKYAVSGIETRLSDGLKAIAADEVSDIAIAGMGGELIAEILDNCRWSKDKTKRFILQPMSKPEILRRYLYESGYGILSEKATESEGKLYTVICAEYNAKPFVPELYQTFIGNIEESENRSLYYAGEVKHINNKAAGFLHMGDKQKAEEYMRAAQKMEELI